MALVISGAGAYTTYLKKDNGKRYYRNSIGVFLLKDGLTGACESGLYNCEYKFNGTFINLPISQVVSDYTATGTASRIFVPD